ncbi:ubiE/COQ5 methyltransferase family [Musa troglodytarum]|uniref:UbiE/COQ5 methyltransferase family n=1 Tax=Musa troglodytarum TaxID=320322 RepID=A0A9E7J8E1_9LILI|nr:ubiE/COQ5 methyltransferase family [Musa troglodytarum]
MAGVRSETESNSPLDVAPRTAAAYLDPHYWDERFAAEEHYEWFKDYSHFQHLLRPFLNPSHSVLEIGCGNSRLCEELRRDGVADITCVDISPVAVVRLQHRLRDMGLEGIKVVQADMLDMPFGGESFDVVIEKGTMGRRMLDNKECGSERPSTPSISLLHEELDDENYIFRTTICEELET